MKSIKDELNEIEIPDELSNRSRLGIERALKEQKPKQNWWSIVGTVIVTAAMFFLVFTLINESNSNPKTTATPSTVSIFSNDYTLALIVTILAFVCSFFVWRRIRWWIIPILLFVLSFTWNIAVFNAHQLGEPVVFPLYIDVEAEGNTTFDIYYATDLRDDRYIASVTFGGETYSPIHDWHQAPGFPYTMHVSMSRYQVLKGTDFGIKIEDLPAKLSTENAYVTFTDGSIQPIMFEHFEFVQPVTVKSKLLETSSSGNQLYSDIRKMEEPFLIEKVHIQKEMQNYIYYELFVNNELIVRQDPSNALNNVNELPYQTEVDEEVKLQLTWVEGTDLSTYNGIVQLYGEGKYMRMSSINPVPSFTTEKVQKLVEQRGDSK